MSLGGLKISKEIPSNKGRLALLLLTLFFVIFIFLLKRIGINPLCFCVSSKTQISRVAHAGGGINGVAYTESIEAMDLNYSKGFRYFEIDFNSTSDASIVCVHDWSLIRNDAKIDNLDMPLSLAEFENVNKSVYSHRRCTLESLVNWFNLHKDAFLVTDVKDNNLETLEEIYNRIPNASTVVIPQIYSPDEYEGAVAVGFQKIIWTLYRSFLDESQILHYLENMDRVIAVTMPSYMAQSFLPLKILSKGVGVYAHTINDPREFLILKQEFCVSEIYTDFLEPGN